MRFLWAIFCFVLPVHLCAQERYVISQGGSAGYQVPVRVVKELGLLEKYQVSAELVAIPGSAKQTDLLLHDRIHFSHTSAVGPVAAFLDGAGDDLAIIAGAFNKSPWSIVTQSAIQQFPDLIGKKIGIADPGGHNELSLVLALKELNLPWKSVRTIPSGDAAARLNALSSKKLDAAVLAPPETFTAEKKRLRILVNLSRLKTAVPLDLIVTRRSLLKKNRAIVKRVLQAFIEAIHLVKTNREKTTAVYQKMMADDNPTIAAGLYEYYAPQFSFPPRVSRKGLRQTAELISERNGFAKRAAQVGRMLDESILDELEKEGFFRTLR